MSQTYKIEVPDPAIVVEVEENVTVVRDARKSNYTSFVARVVVGRNVVWTGPVIIAYWDEVDVDDARQQAHDEALNGFGERLAEVLGV